MRVVIVGAGLSGLTLAAFLRCLNIDCVVLDQAPFLRAQYLPPYTLYANALSCFKAFGMANVFSDYNVPPEEFFGIRDEKGKWLWRAKNKKVRLQPLNSQDIIPMTTAPPANSESIVSQRLAEQFFYDMGCVPLRCTVAADRLREILRRNVPELKCNSRVIDLVPREGIKGGVHVVLEGGATEWGDIVVGADGMHSVVRNLLYPEESVATTASSSGILQIDGFIDTPKCPSVLEHPVSLWGHRRTLSCVPLYRHGENRICFTASVYDQPSDLVDCAGDAAAMREAMRGVMHREFASFLGEVRDLLPNADLALPSEVLEVPVMPRWFYRRAVLIGEAAHGSLPSFLNQDASLCVEDAALLATALLDVPLNRDSGYEYAFRQFESVRRDRVERYIRHSRLARRFMASSHSTARNYFVRAVPPTCVYLSQSWLSRWSYSAQQLMVDPKIKMETAYR